MPEPVVYMASEPALAYQVKTPGPGTRINKDSPAPQVWSKQLLVVASKQLPAPGSGTV